jgi:DNA-damage-inducible protein D
MSIVKYQKNDKMSSIKLFESKQIRSVWNESEQKWYFAIIDVIEVLTE